MAIYLVDYENVYIEGLTGLETLTKHDEVLIFYTQNRCGLTFELHRRLISCRASLQLMEVSATSTRKNTIKNALDLQLSMYIGYLVGRRPHVPIYIISKDTDFDLDLAFFTQYLQQKDGASLTICETIEDALNGISQLTTNELLQQAEELAQSKESAQEISTASSNATSDTGKRKKSGAAVVFPKALKNSVRELLKLEDASEINRICAIVTASEDLLTLNNLLSRYYHKGKELKVIYHKLKPQFKVLRRVAVEQN